MLPHLYTHTCTLYNSLDHIITVFPHISHSSLQQLVNTIDFQPSNSGSWLQRLTAKKIQTLLSPPHFIFYSNHPRWMLSARTKVFMSRWPDFILQIFINFLASSPKLVSRSQFSDNVNSLSDRCFSSSRRSSVFLLGRSTKRTAERCAFTLINLHNESPFKSDVDVVALFPLYFIVRVLQSAARSPAS